MPCSSFDGATLNFPPGQQLLDLLPDIGVEFRGQVERKGDALAGYIVEGRAQPLYIYTDRREDVGSSA